MFTEEEKIRAIELYFKYGNKRSRRTRTWYTYSYRALF